MPFEISPPSPVSLRTFNLMAMPSTSTVCASMMARWARSKVAAVSGVPPGQYG